jgi:carbon storage regulator CsrA
MEIAMLVLSRKEGQSVEMPELNVVVRVISLTKSRVQLGIEAPREITVNRSEKPYYGERREDREASEVKRIRDELTRVEAELAALAELVGGKDQPMACRIAADSIKRLDGLKRSLQVTVRQPRTEALPIAELVKVRTDVLEQLREQQMSQSPRKESVAWSDSEVGKPNCVRQSPTNYSVVSSPLEHECSVA